MNIILALHVLCVFIWMGMLLSLTRLMGYHVKEDAATQRHLARIYNRMYNFIDLPAMALSLVLGLVLIACLDKKEDLTWFFVKMGFVAGLLVCDTICGRWIAVLGQGPVGGKGVKYKVLHMATGALLIGIIFTIYAFRRSCA